MANQSYWGRKQPGFTDISKSDIPIDTAYGIYVGTIKAIDTEFRNGRLYVYIPGFSGGNPNDPSSLPQVTYASPFLGRTLNELSPEPGLFTRTGQSYGMSFPLPDVGSEVLCCFPDGQRQYGYWFACVTNKLSRNMVPDIGAIDANLIMTESVPEELKKFMSNNQKYPAGEINEEQNGGPSPDWYKTESRPLHLPRMLQLWNQGLDSDSNRGITTSSGQRDPISAVYGFITPGRPVSDPGKIPEVIAATKSRKISETEAARFIGQARKGGHSLVLDDGDFNGNNNLVRLRSSAGHQIILNDTEGFIYVSTASGKNWIELTNSGDCLIYNHGDLAIRTEGNMFFHSDKKLNLNGNQVNINATQEMNLQAPFLNLSATNRANMYANYLSLQGRSTSLAGSNRVSIDAAGSVNVNGSVIYLNSGGSRGNISPPRSIPKYQFKDVKGVRIPVSNITAQFTPNNNPFIDLWSQEPTPSLISINVKIPTHEPYDRTGQGSRTGNITNAAAQQGLINLASLTGNANDLANISSQYPGVAIALRQVVNQAKKAPPSAFISQPAPSESIGTLTKDQTQAYMAQIGHSESTGNYQRSNSLGYQGKYQLGSAALQDLGYVKPGTPQTQEALSNPNNWMGGPGKPNNLDEFLKSPDIQEQAMTDYTKRNYNSLKNLGLVNENSSPELVSGYMSAAHLGGPGGVEKWAKGGLDAADANGSTISSYFQLGRYSQTQTTVIAASNASRPAG